jgi:hypothetical protein
MRRLTFLAFLIAQGMSVAAAAECPASGDLKAAENLIPQAATCAAAARVARACAVGAGGDLGLVAAAEQVCQASFLKRLDRKHLQRFQSQRQACQRKYRNESGTMYRSFEAFCELSVSERFARGGTAPEQ